MSHTWILDVLADLKAYARKNDLATLAEHLDDVRHVAFAEIAMGAGVGSMGADTGGEVDRSSHEARLGGAA